MKPKEVVEEKEEDEVLHDEILLLVRDVVSSSAYEVKILQS